MADPRDQFALQDISARMQQGDLVSARNKCESFLATTGDTTRQTSVRIWLGLIEQRSGNLPAALNHYELARKNDRRNPDLIMQLGLAHFE